MNDERRKLTSYLALLGTQSFSALGSGMTRFALVIWLYQTSGSALETALLSVCSYAPYVTASIFAGALSDRWDKRRVMLACDLCAAVCTVVTLCLLRAGALRPWHLYVLNAVNGLMGTLQQPASDVAATLLVPPAWYQRSSGLRSLSNSLNTLLTPVFATALFALAGMEAVIAFDLGTFALAFAVLLCCIRIPPVPRADGAARQGVLSDARAGLRFVRGQPLALTLMLYLACINLVASAYEAALPALLLSRVHGGEAALGLVNACAGAATLLGSALATLLPAPRERVRVIRLTLLLSMSTENFLLAFGRTPIAWCVGSVLGWLAIPLMNANLDVILRSSIPPGMQGRVYACRNTLQFFTIPLGYLAGGLLVDRVFQPLMDASDPAGTLARLFGRDAGAGAALTFFALGVAGVLVCLIFNRLLRGHVWRDAGPAQAGPD